MPFPDFFPPETPNAAKFLALAFTFAKYANAQTTSTTGSDGPPHHQQSGHAPSDLPPLIASVASAAALPVVLCCCCAVCCVAACCAIALGKMGCTAGSAALRRIGYDRTP